MRASPATRRGSVVVLTAFSMIFLLGMVAFAVDVGYITTTRNELQTAADAAALAGASQLLDPSLLTASQTEAVAAARAEAQRFALQNQAAGVAIQLDENAANAASGGIVVGGISSTADADAVLDPNAPFANAVSVRTERAENQNGALQLFFASVLGRDSTEVAATATAGFETQITGFRITGRNPAVTHSKLLPFVMDVNTWNQVVSGAGPDAWRKNTETGVVTAGGDGIPEAGLYGANTFTTANFGTVNIGAPNNSTNDIARQILYGPNQADFAYMGGKFELGPSGTRNVSGDPGLSAGFKDELASIIGQPRIIPLYNAVWGNGANAQYTIVGFAGVTITSVKLTGRDKLVTIQPDIVIDPTAYSGGTTSNSSTSYVYGPITLLR